jgi:hypothetical protein
METEFYICEFCKTKFKPNRRKVQRFCSTSCRVKNHHHKNKVEKPLAIAAIPNIGTEAMDSTIFKPDKHKVDKMSLAGVGNAAAGTAAFELAKKLLTPKNNIPATKSDIQDLTINIHKMTELINKRYFLIHNLAQKYDGALPYFDMGTGNVIYFR